MSYYSAAETFDVIHVNYPPSLNTHRSIVGPAPRVQHSTPHTLSPHVIGLLYLNRAPFHADFQSGVTERVTDVYYIFLIMKLDGNVLLIIYFICLYVAMKLSE